MASFTKKTSFRRRIRATNAGASRKRLQRLNGTTPRFAVHTPEADANAPKAQLSPKK